MQMGRMDLAWVQRAAERSHLQGAWWSQSSSSPLLFQSSVISVRGSAAADYVLNHGTPTSGFPLAVEVPAPPNPAWPPFCASSCLAT